LYNNQYLFDWFEQKKILHTLKFIQVSPTVRLLNDNLFKALVQENFFHLGSTIIKKSIVNGILFDESIMYSEDRDFAISLFKQANASFAYRKDPVFNAYIHDSNICNTGENKNRQKVAEAHIYLFMKYLSSYDLSIIEKKLLNKRLAKKFAFLSYLYVKNNQYFNALSFFYKSFKYYLAFLKISST
jgi:hypothetical protein